MRYIANILLIVFSLLLSCDKDEASSILISKATIKWSDYAVDGCGFFITINEHKYKPENESNIDESFKTGEEIQVLVKYIKLNSQIGLSCGDSPWGIYFDGIVIISIKSIEK
ncbi:MAG: hypothetical protein K8R86_06680 [Bacteroidales bacterium]|nr:hypothetical protein [Bacteroidales bacterium]